VKSVSSNIVAGWCIIGFLLLYPTIEGLIISAYGTTPGKFAFGIRVLQNNGDLAPAGIAVYRSYLVQLFGNALYIPIAGTVANIALFIQLIRGKSAIWDKKCNLIVVHKPLGAELLGGIVLLAIAIAGLCLTYPTLIKPELTSASNSASVTSPNVSSTQPNVTASAVPAPPPTDGPSSTVSNGTLAWNLPFAIGDSIDTVRKDCGQPDAIENEKNEPQVLLIKVVQATYNPQQSSPDGSQTSDPHFDNWTRYTPNLQIESYSQYGLFLHYISSKLRLISINSETRDDNKMTASVFHAPIINGLLLSDDRETLFKKLGPPNNPQMIGVPEDIVFDKQSYPGSPSVYSWDFGTILVLVSVRDKDETTTDNVTLPANSVSQVMIISRLPPDQYQRLEPIPHFPGSVRALD
jgi:uncharacterized RDD family membrane protein YckC